LTSDEGVVLRRRRSTDVETVFGDVKRNWGFRRFTLRGIETVAHEWRLLMMGHNIRKLTGKIAEAAAGTVPVVSTA
ncbi:MAG: transposase, partial [Eggerthellaceae bacterium]|nr:transposase [Eggerthellaceae bacterium]